MARLIYRWLGWILCLGLVACTSVPGLAPSSPPPGRHFYDTIELSGRLSVQYLQNNKYETLHGGFIWLQKPQSIALTLRSPLGQTLATVDITPTMSTLVQANRPPRMATDVDALIQETLGWPLPLSELRQWLQGFAIIAGNQSVTATPTTPSTVVTQEGWRVQYVTWQTETSPPHPKRIDLARSTTQAGDVSIRLVIDRWQTP